MDDKASAQLNESDKIKAHNTQQLKAITPIGKKACRAQCSDSNTQSVTQSAHGFAQHLITWQKQSGRHHLPWQQTRDAYHIWLSEIMLQQTQVNTVIDYYQRFLKKFPTVHTLAQASLDEVMSLWAGLGYYSRARNLHHCAQKIVMHYAGIFPSDPNELIKLPGIGQSTAAAISAFAYGTRAAILDGNVKRIFTRVFGISGHPNNKTVERQLWQLAKTLLPENDIEVYTQGLMDFGATLCKRTQPLCLKQATLCPFSQTCIAHQEQRIAELPTPKPKKTLPLRHAIVLIIRDQQDVLLQRRPLTGIWGGLWCLPQIELTDAITWPGKVEENWLSLAQTFGEISSYQALPEYLHTFTHFRLRLLPLLIDINTLKTNQHLHQNVASYTADIAQQWISLIKQTSIGMPTPIERLLKNLIK